MLSVLVNINILDVDVEFIISFNVSMETEHEKITHDGVEHARERTTTSTHQSEQQSITSLQCTLTHIPTL